MANGFISTLTEDGGATEKVDAYLYLWYLLAVVQELYSRTRELARSPVQSFSTASNVVCRSAFIEEELERYVRGRHAERGNSARTARSNNGTGPRLALPSSVPYRPISKTRAASVRRQRRESKYCSDVTSSSCLVQFLLLGARLMQRRRVGRGGGRRLAVECRYYVQHVSGRGCSNDPSVQAAALSMLGPSTSHSLLIRTASRQ